MSEKLGMKKYPEGISDKIREKHKNSQSVNSLSKEYGINRWAIQSWCGLTAKSEIIPKQRGRKPAKTLQEYKFESADETVVQVLNEPGKKLRQIRECGYTVRGSMRKGILPFSIIRERETVTTQLSFSETIRDIWFAMGMTDTTN